MLSLTNEVNRMLTITLPDGSQKNFDHPVTIQEIAQRIGAGLAKAAIAGKVDDRLVDTFYTVNQDAQVRIITDKDPEGIEIIRHSTAHLLAHAVKTLFPQVQVTIGPVIENGFYYDFDYDKPFTVEDLTKIEEKMQEIANTNYSVSARAVPRDEAITFFESMGEHFKVKIIQDIPPEETLTIYQQGDFADLCRGPHVPTTGHLKAFKLTKVSGAYWRGDAKNPMLQRIYGTAWRDKKSLDTYLKNLEEAENRDHRKLAKSMDLFHMQEEAPGMVFWHANGWSIYKTIKEYISQHIAQDYQEIVTPQIVDLELWKKSGHWANFGQEMFVVETPGKQFAIKPMSCPCHILVYKQGLTSYRELPVRFAEFGCVHRNEMTGAMHGLMRVRQLTQDDGHIFCMDSQIKTEAMNFIKTTLDCYKDFGFEEVILKLATRPEKRIGDDALWDQAEKALADALSSLNLHYDVLPGEGAFYGPKIEFHLKDCIGRMWQCGTLQIDYAMPGRLEAYYISEDGSKRTPVMLHRAILGSVERFMGILLEHHAGKLPLWLAPVQAVVMNITDKQLSYIKNVEAELKKHGLRVKSDLRNEKIGFKIREHTLELIPYLIIVGDREQESGTLTVRTQSGKDLGQFTISNFVAHLQSEVSKRGRHA